MPFGKVLHPVEVPEDVEYGLDNAAQNLGALYRAHAKLPADEVSSELRNRVRQEISFLSALAKVAPGKRDEIETMIGEYDLLDLRLARS